MDDLFFNIFNDEFPAVDPLNEIDRPAMLPVYNDIPDDPPFLLDDGIIPDNGEEFFVAPPVRKRRFMDHRTSIFTIIREAPAKEPTPNHNKFLEKRRRAVALRLNAQSSGDSSKPLEMPQPTQPRVIKKIEQKMRNRISAQMSRDRKKSYINILERQNADLRKENRNLKDELEALQDEISKMREKCALSTAESGPKTSHQRNNTQSNGGSDRSSNNGSQNQSRTMTEEGNNSEQNSEAIFNEAHEEGMQRHAISGNSLFLSLFSVLSVCAMVAMTSGPNGMHADGLHAQAERLRVLAAMQPRCAGYGEHNSEVQALYDKVHRLKSELNASKFEQQNKKCPEPEILAKQSSMSFMNSSPVQSSFSSSPKANSKYTWGKESGKRNLRSTAIMEYRKETGMSVPNSSLNHTNSTNSTGTLFCPSGVIVANSAQMLPNLRKQEKEVPSVPLVSMNSIEALEQTFGKDQMIQIILPTTNLTVLKQMPNGKSEITQFGNREDKLIEMICVVKGLNEVS